MAFDARAIANYFLAEAAKENHPLDAMGIQKLIYFAHGWNLAIFGAPLIQQRVEAWDYGPVIVDVYKAFREFGTGPITSPAKKFDYDPISELVSVTEPIIPKTDETKNTRALLDKVWELNKHLSSLQLANLTHQPDSPWTIARQEGKHEVDDSLIRTYIETQARQDAAPVG